MASPCGRHLGHRPFVGDVVGDVESSQCLNEKQGEQDEHHPAASRVVSDLVVGLSLKRMFQVL